MKITCVMMAANAVALSAPSILKFKDGKQGAFMLEFDDSCETHITKAIPELVKRDLVGTFFINPGGGPYNNRRKDWEKKVTQIPQVVIANHTFKHKGAPDLATVEEDMILCKEVIDRVFSGGKKERRLVSFGRPGGVPWNITNDEFNTLLKKYDLVLRPDFRGYPIHYKTEAEVLALVDQAIEKGELRYNVAHGVGGDWLSIPMDIYTNLLDKLVVNRDKLWITDPISYHKYKTEREAAKLTYHPDSTPDKPRLKLEITTDPALYDMPLTIEVPLPDTWEDVKFEQKSSDPDGALLTGGIREISNGVLRVDVSPRNSEITFAIPNF